VKRIIIFLLLFISLSSYSQIFEIPPLKNGGDKILHFTVSYTLTYHSYHYLKSRVPKNKAKLYSALITISIGVAKEAIDEKWRKGSERGDLIANSLGTSFALITIKF